MITDCCIESILQENVSQITKGNLLELRHDGLAMMSIIVNDMCVDGMCGGVFFLYFTLFSRLGDLKIMCSVCGIIASISMSTK